MKVVVRDASLKQRHQPEIDGVLRDIERWVSEAKAAVDISSGNLGWEDIDLDDSSVSSTQVTKERLALEALCDNLMEKGALVPLAKKSVVSLKCSGRRFELKPMYIFRKRVLDAKSFHPQGMTVSLWMPLIHHIEALHAGFITILITQLTIQLLNEPSGPGPGAPPARDSSHDSLIAAWVIYLLDTRALSAGDKDVDQGLMDKANVIPIVMGGLGPLRFSTLSGRKT